MIKDNQKYFNRVHVVIDAVVIMASYILSWYIRFRSGLFQMDPWYLSLQEYCKALIFIVPGYLILYYVFQLYTSKRVQGRRLEAWHILQANTIGLMGFILILYLIKQSDFSRTMFFVFFCVNVSGEIFVRNLIRYLLRDIRKRDTIKNTLY